MTFRSRAFIEARRQRIADDLDQLEELCTCTHPRRQHMAHNGPCCHLTTEGPRPLNLTCVDCHTFTPARGTR